MTTPCKDKSKSSESLNESEDRTSLMKIIGKAIGLDITKIAIPVKYNEPFSFLQRMMEYLQYTDLLEEASSSEDPYVRALFVGIFSISCFSNTSRTVKPFNPLLGETFEYEDPSKNLKFVAEQVSHHPPIGASHCETPNIIYYQTQTIKTKFLGNSLDVTPSGTSTVILKRWDERYSWSNIKTVVNNLVIGKMWIDHYGKSSITVCRNSTNEVFPIKVDLNYKKCGWFGRGWREVRGQVTDQKKKNYFTITGKWNEELFATCDPSVSKIINYKNINFSDLNPHSLWKQNCEKCCEKHLANFDWSNFTAKLNSLDENVQLGLPCSDSRLREDKLFLEKGDLKKSSRHKNSLEEAQRLRKKSLEESKMEYTPKYFESIDTKDGKVYIFNSKYWNERSKRYEENSKLNKKTSIEDANAYWLKTLHQQWCNKV